VPESPRALVVPIRSPGPRGVLAAPPSPFNTPSTYSPSPFSPSSSSSFKPAVKVKPLLQVKPIDVKKDEVKK
jgi:hypothetical protein